MVLTAQLLVAIALAIIGWSHTKAVFNVLAKHADPEMALRHDQLVMSARLKWSRREWNFTNVMYIVGFLIGALFGFYLAALALLGACLLNKYLFFNIVHSPIQTDGFEEMWNKIHARPISHPDTRFPS